MLSSAAGSYRVREGLAYCVSNDRTIFLDILANRYFSLSPALDEIFRRVIFEEPSEQVKPAELARLVRANIVDSQDHQLFNHSSRAIEPPLRELRHIDTATSTILLANCVFAQARASIRLRRRSLAWLPQWVRERRRISSERRSPETAWQVVTDAFAATVSIRPRSDRCLSSSIAFLDVGFSRDLDAQLVFGVYSCPFSAHCWVQAGDTVLNDRIENVRTFTPILAI
ncbi:lasso peptide biosynthesis B2 protein [Sphingobium sp. V4]|uniref:lasso peptide biosynthesis B2 protein n=1 Tax=Sphingobium sp. V4 TaxID=3038927 RepID=UPI0025580858|nr:lasso peptide biosynthesis B2 protein [Sphingobium sp. V4]WIW89567.1 lasso peptide biosynthesis B2 protein [Sphingobium sp. V4]